MARPTQPRILQVYAVGRGSTGIFQVQLKAASGIVDSTSFYEVDSKVFESAATSEFFITEAFDKSVVIGVDGSDEVQTPALP